MKKNIILITCLAAALGACELPDLQKRTDAVGGDSETLGASMPTTITTDGYAGFSYVYTITRNKCAGCHGANQAPKFAVSDVAQAHQMTLNLVDFANVPASRLVAKMKDGHCGGACTTDGTEMANAITLWKMAEAAATGVNPPADGPGTSGDSSEPVASVTTELALTPPALPTGTSYKAFRFNLADARPADPDLTGVIFEIEAQQFAAPLPGIPGAYRFRRPRLATPTKPIYVKGIKVLINGRYDPATNDFVDVESVVAPGTVNSTNPGQGFPLLSSDLMIAVQDKASGDRISIAFDELRAAPAAGCKALATFVQKVKPVMSTTCAGCHNVANSTAMRRFPMNGTDEQLCARALQRIDTTNPPGSALITQPLNGTNGHTRVSGFSGSSPSWLDWIEAER